MIRHYIIMSSSYTEGTRIALDIVEESKLNKESIAGILKEIKETWAVTAPAGKMFLFPRMSFALDLKTGNLFNDMTLSLRMLNVFQLCLLLLRQSKKAVL